MRTRTRWGLGLVILGAFALRLYRLGAPSLWYDETVSLYLARQDLVALTAHTAGDIHPPFYYYLLHFWGSLAGWSEFSAAFLSLWFGVLLVALVFRVARDWFDRRTGFIAAVLVAMSAYNLWYSQEVRMYTLGAALGLVSVYLFVRVLARETRRDLVTYLATSALGLYTLYYFAFLLVFENLIALLRVIAERRTGERRRLVRAWIISQAGILLLYLPWAPIAFRQATDPPVPPWRSFTPVDQMLVESFKALSLGQSVELGIALPVLVIVAGIAGFALGARRGIRRPEIVSPLFLLGYTFVPLAAITIFSLVKPLYHVRYVFTYSPAFYLLIGLGLAQLVETRARSRLSRAAFSAALVLFVGASAYSAYNFWYDPAYAKDDLRGAVQRISALWRPGDAVLIDAGYTYTAFDYYNSLPVSWRGRLTEYTPPGDRDGLAVLQTGSIGGEASLGWGNPTSDFYATTEAETRAALDRVFAAHPRVWLLRLYDTVVDPGGVVREYLASHGRIIDDADFRGNSFARVEGYLTPLGGAAELPVRALARPILLGERVLLVAWAGLAAEPRAGSPLDFNLYWQSVQPTNVDVHLFIGLYSRDGKLVASSDEVPIGNAWGTSRWEPGSIQREPVRLLVPSRLSAGDYVLRVALYNPLTNEPLVGDAGSGVGEDGQVELGAVHIGP